MAKTLTPIERETVITLNDEEDTMHVVTYQRKIITKLKKNPSFMVDEEGSFGSTRWMSGTLPATLLTLRMGRK